MNSSTARSCSPWATIRATTFPWVMILAVYPMTLEGWEQAEIVTQGNVVALIVAQGSQDQAVDAFNALFA